jgi:hypothetical protein
MVSPPPAVGLRALPARHVELAVVHVHLWVRRLTTTPRPSTRRPEVLSVVDVPEPEAGPGQTLHDVSAAGVNYADTHHPVSSN